MSHICSGTENPPKSLLEFLESPPNFKHSNFTRCFSMIKVAKCE